MKGARGSRISKSLVLRVNAVFDAVRSPQYGSSNRGSGYRG